MRVEIDIRIGEMAALAEPGHRRRDQAVAACLHQRVHFLPAPAGRPGAMRNDECSHFLFPRIFYSAATARSFRLLKRARTASSRTTANPAASTCQPGLMPASKSNTVSSTRSGDT